MDLKGLHACLSFTRHSFESFVIGAIDLEDN